VGHRATIVNERLAVMGAACERHRDDLVVCEMDYAGGFEPR
jgi:hypothetical protein